MVSSLLFFGIEYDRAPLRKIIVVYPRETTAKLGAGSCGLFSFCFSLNGFPVDNRRTYGNPSTTVELGYNLRHAAAEWSFSTVFGTDSVTER